MSDAEFSPYGGREAVVTLDLGQQLVLAHSLNGIDTRSDTQNIPLENEQTAALLGEVAALAHGFILRARPDEDSDQYGSVIIQASNGGPDSELQQLYVRAGYLNYQGLETFSPTDSMLVVEAATPKNRNVEHPRVGFLFRKVTLKSPIDAIVSPELFVLDEVTLAEQISGTQNYMHFYTQMNRPIELIGHSGSKLSPIEALSTGKLILAAAFEAVDHQPTDADSAEDLREELLKTFAVTPDDPRFMLEVWGDIGEAKSKIAKQLMRVRQETRRRAMNLDGY